MAKAAELDTELVNGLKAAKSKRAYFALILKGSKDGALIVSKTKVPPTAIAEAKKQSGGSAVLKGFCLYEDGTYVFETAKEAPATAPQAVKVIAKRDAGLAVKAEFRISTDSELLADEGDATATAPPKAPPGPPQADGAEVIKRLNAMTADIKTALAGPNKAQVQALYVAINGQIKSKAFPEAAKGLDELQNLLKPATSPSPQADGAELTKRLNAITADIKTALAGPNKVRVQALFVAASGQIKGKEFAPAGKSLDELEQLVKPTGGTLADGAASPSKKISPAFTQLWKQAKGAWQDAVDTVNSQFERLRSALINFDEKKYPEIAAMPPEAKEKLKKQLKAVAEGGLSQVVDGQRVALQVAIANVDQASDDVKKAKFIVDAQGLVKSVQTYVASSEKIEVCDDNGLDVEVTVRSELGGALAKLDEALAKALVG